MSYHIIQQGLSAYLLHIIGFRKHFQIINKHFINQPVIIPSSNQSSIMRITKMHIHILLLIGLFLFNSCIISMKATEEKLVEAKSQEYDAIIVPGVPFKNGKWSSIMKARVIWSKYLYEQGIARNIIYSGSAVYSPYYEAVIMALYAEELGIPRENIFIEDKAEHSTENVYYSHKKARNMGFKKIALATDPFQSKMVESFTRRRVSKNVGFIPIVFDTLKVYQQTIENTDPEIAFDKAFKEDFQSLVDRESFWERLKGTKGKKINENYYELPIEEQSK